MLFKRSLIFKTHICGIMTWTSGVSEEFRKPVVDAHQAGKGYQSICEALGCHQSAVRPTVYKWKKFRSAVSSSSSCLPIKINPRARCVIVCKVTEQPGVTPKQLNASLTLAVHVHGSAIRITPSSGITMAAREKPLLLKKNAAVRPQSAEDHADKPEGCLKAVCSVDGLDQNKTFGL